MSNALEVYGSVTSGERAGSATAIQLPDVPCRMVWITALGDNAGNVYIGGAGVTVPNGTTDITSGLTLDAGVPLGPLPVDNLNRLYMVCDNAGDDITYLALG